MKNNSLFSKGYSDCRKRINKGSRFNMSCFNCHYYYQASGDKEEVCQNPSVLEFDMIVTDNSVYCNKWELCHRETSAKSLFKKGRCKRGNT